MPHQIAELIVAEKFYFLFARTGWNLSLLRFRRRRQIANPLFNIKKKK
jgi:hypothetical protein